MIVKPFFLFAPGAGAPSSHPWMQRWKESLMQIGDVETLDYDYMREGRKRPDRLPQLISAHRAALAAARTKTSGAIILIGKSMGGRVGCHVAMDEKVDGLVCMGYRLCAVGGRSKWGGHVLRDLHARVVVVQGRRHALARFDLFE